MLTTGQIQAVFTAANAKFGQRLKGLDPSPWRGLATLMPTSALRTEHPWVGEAPQMRSWQGEKIISSLTSGSFTVINAPFESTIGIPKLLVETNQLAGLDLGVGKLARAAANWGAKQIRDLIANGTDADFASGYDGQPLYSSSHGVGEAKSQTNLVSGSGVTAAKVADDWGAVVVAMSLFKDDRGEFVEPIMPDTAVIPPSGPLRSAFQKLLQGKSDELPDLSGELKRVIIHPGLTDLTDWYAFATVGVDLSAIIMQVLSNPTTKSDNPFGGTELLFGVEAAGAVAVGDFRCTCKVGQ